MMEYRILFDADSLAARLRVPKDEYETLKQSVREEFPTDEMMYQLHLVRALHARSKKLASSVEH